MGKRNDKIAEFQIKAPEKKPKSLADLQLRKGKFIKF